MKGGILSLGLFGAAMMASLCATAGRGEFTASDGVRRTKEGLLGRQAWLSGILTNRSAFMDGFFKMFFHESPPTEWVTRLRSDLDRTPAPAAFTLQATASPLNRMPILEGLKFPVLFVHQAMLDREAARITERAPKVEAVRMEGVGHALFVEKADEFNRPVETFLDQRASRR